MTQIAKDRYVVAIDTPVGRAIIESVKQWEELLELGRYNAVLRSNRASDTGKVKISAIFKCGCDNCRTGIRGGSVKVVG